MGKKKQTRGRVLHDVWGVGEDLGNTTVIVTDKNMTKVKFGKYQHGMDKDCVMWCHIDDLIAYDGRKKAHREAAA